MKLFVTCAGILIVLIFNIYCERVHLTCDQIRTFVDGHNTHRLNVAQGMLHGHPAASNMKYMIWDEELAEKAAKWAEHGVFAHNPDRTIGSRRWDLVGENIFYSYFYSTEDVEVKPNLQEPMTSWFNEHLNYSFTPFVLGAPKEIGHYTQMVWADSSRVGCGISQKKQSGPMFSTFTLFVCDYGPTGNFIGQLPYKTIETPGYLHCTGDECSKPYGHHC